MGCTLYIHVHVLALTLGPRVMSCAVLLRLSSRSLQRLLLPTWQAETAVRASVQPLATWTERIKRWSSGSQAGKVCTVRRGLGGFG